MTTPVRCSARPSATRPATSWTWRRSPGWPTRRRAAHRRQHRRHTSDAEAVRPRRRRGRAFADQVRGRPRHDHRRRHRRRRTVPVDRSPGAVPDVQRTRAGVPRRGIRPRLPRQAVHRACPLDPTSQHRGHALARSTPSSSCRAWRPWRSDWSATRPTPGQSPTTWPPTRGWSG